MRLNVQDLLTMAIGVLVICGPPAASSGGTTSSRPPRRKSMKRLLQEGGIRHLRLCSMGWPAPKGRGEQTVTLAMR